MTELTKNKYFANTRSGNMILTILFFISISLLIWAIDIYRLTIIDIKYLCAISIIGGLISLLTLSVLKTSYSKIWTLLIKSFVGAGIFYFGFLYLNQKLSDKEILTNNFNIIKTGTLAKGKSGSCRSPYAIINFDGIEKELVFYCDIENTIQNYKSIKLTYSKGFLGFVVIRAKSLNY